MPLIYHYDLTTPYMITDKFEGKLLIDTFGILPFEAKVMIHVHF